MSNLCPKYQYFVGAPLLSSTDLILLGMEFTRAAQVVAGILFHSSIMTSRSCWMLDTWCFSTFRLKMPHMCSIGFRSGDILGHSITFTFSSKAVVILAVCFGVVVMLEKQFLKGGHHLLLQNVTVHVGIHVSLNEPQLPSTSSSHAAPDHDATTTMLDCRQGTIFLVRLTRASSHMLDTIWVKQVYLRLIRPQDMVPVNSCSWTGCLQQTVCRLFCEPASEEASLWDDGHANRLVAVCGVWSEHWQADLPLLQPLKQCWQNSSVCFLKTASAPDAQHKDSTSLIDPCEACSEWNPSWKTSVWPWPLYCN